MRLLEAFTLEAFWTQTPYFIDSGTLLGCVRHFGVIPWDNDIDVAMLRDDFTRFVDDFQEHRHGKRLTLERHAYGDPDACVWFNDRASGVAGLDLTAYTPDGRSLMSEAIQREWPIDAWGSRRGPGSWRYDFGHPLDEFEILPSFCGFHRAPRRWRERLARHYDDLEMAPDLRARAMDELGFDPGHPPARPVLTFASVADGLAATRGREPFAVPNCREVDLDLARLERAIYSEPLPFQAYHPSSGLRFDTIRIRGEDALGQLRAGTLDVNIFDTPASLPLTTLPVGLRHPNPVHERFPFHIGYLLSPAPYETIFHTDGFVHTYNHLLEGEKWWWFLEPVGADQSVVCKMSLTEILTEDKFRRWGRMRVLRQEPGTLIVLPGYWPHRVLTTRPALGLAGYVNLEVGAG
jgi:hypothetical protein